MNARKLPPDLRRYVVQQDYSRYDAADQATWRFVLLHLYEHLKTAAHASYIAGLASSGLSTRSIPRIDDMDRALGELGWGAVCVNGFIPPRAFQRFQALGVLPIAADIRKPNHVAYTPAPDIIHEAAGHAPILADADYSEYLKRSGQVGEVAFSSRHDHAVHEAITVLSRVKELCPDDGPEVRVAERRLNDAIAAQTETSEAARMARLYWWTAEYGLIGTPKDFKLYGAGLLSSLGEAVYCLEPSVTKIPLDTDCMDVSYDITRPQPQLFVTPSFPHLFDVLDAAAKGLAANEGALPSLDAAIQSGLPAKIELSNGEQLEGTLRSYGTDLGRPAWLELDTARTSLGSEDKSRNVLVPLGMPETPIAMSELSRRAQERREMTLIYPSGLRLHGVLVAAKSGASAPQLSFSDVRISVRGKSVYVERLSVPLGAEVVRALPADEPSDVNEPPRVNTAPVERQLEPSERDLRELFERGAQAWRNRAGGNCVETFESIHQALKEHYPDEWLLRWNLLENLLQLGERDRANDMISELELLELKHQGREPIATGLGSLRARAAPSNDSIEEAS